MKVGFTGSREKVTKWQLATLYRLVRHLGAKQLHHGDCFGADVEAHHVALSDKLVVHIHPSDIEAARAFCEEADHVYEPKPFLERNKDIVDAVQAVIGMPNSTHEKMRSGTWHTLRYARKQKVPTYIIWPKGEITVGWGRDAKELKI